MTRVLRTRPQVWLEVDGLGEYEIIRFQSDWGVNEIPKAACELAIGREASNGTVAAKIHSTLNSLRNSRRRRTRVWAQFDGDWDLSTSWPSGRVLLFDGRLTGVGYQPSLGKVAFVVSLAHWLIELNYSSILSARSHPSNPSDLTFNAIVNSLPRAGAPIPGTNPLGLAATAEAQTITPASIQADLWGAAIKPMLCGLARSQHVQISPEVGAYCEVFDNGDNSAALDALARIEGTANTDESCDKELSCYTPPLSLSLPEDAIADLSVAGAIATTIGNQAMDTLSNQTIWGKILEFAGEFYFGVVPLIDKALVVPLVPGVRRVYCKTITSDEYASNNISGEIQRPLRGVAIVAGRASATGFMGAPESGFTSWGIGGCFAPDTVTTRDGMLLFRHAPSWIYNIPFAGFSATRTTGLADRRAINCALAPVDLDPELQGNADGHDATAVMRSARDLANGFAHAFYVTEALRGRIGYVPGKLRFDISPGSNVWVEGATEKFLGNSQVGQAMVGTVVRVNCSIDAENRQASTTFQLAYCRTEEENKSDLFSLDLHPLYRGEPFLGAPLHDDLWFANGDCCL